MIPLAVCSFLAIYVFLTKSLTLRAGVLLDPQALIAWRSWLGLWKKGEFAQHKLERTLLHQVMETVFPLAPMKENVLHEKIREQFSVAQIKLNRHMHVLEIVTNISPLLGLLGTAVGMLKVFSGLSDRSLAVGSLSEGIAEALITTIVGLSIAVPSFVAHGLFAKKIEHTLSRLEIQVNELIFEFGEKLASKP